MLTSAGNVLEVAGLVQVPANAQLAFPVDAQLAHQLGVQGTFLQ
jgi:hypothetical protein